MSNNRAIYLFKCEVIDSRDPENPVNSFTIQATGPMHARKQLKPRIYLKKTQKLVITKIKKIHHITSFLYTTKIHPITDEEDRCQA